MQQLKINQISDTGIHESEIEALERISKALPTKWLAYSNFEFRGREFGNREIDLVLVTEHNIILVELKNWNGSLTSDGTRWIQNGQNRGKSPVLITNDKAKKLKSLLLEREGHNFTYAPYIEPLVVLCGSATPDNLTEGDKHSTVTIDEFCRIGERSTFNKVFPSTKQRKAPLCSEKEVFNRFFSRKYFDARKHRYSDYIPLGDPIFKHKDHVYEEYIAEHEFSKGHKALLRTWDLAALPPLYSTESQWRMLVRRETEVIGYLKQTVPFDVIQASILTRLSGTPEAELSQHNYELFELPSSSELLEDFIHKTTRQLSISDRLRISRNILGLFSSIHEANVAHRDVSETSLWTGHSSNVAASRWLAAAFPEGKTIGGMRDALHSGKSVAPEDKFGVTSDPFRRDVFLLGRVIYFVLSGRHLPLNEGVSEYQPLSEALQDQHARNDDLIRAIGELLERSLNWEPSKRHANAIELSTHFLSLQPEAQSHGSLYRRKIESYKTETIPYLSYPPKNSGEAPSSTFYRAYSNDEEVIVKVWPSLQPSSVDDSTNLRLLNFLETCMEIKRTSHLYTQNIIDFGISPVGLFLVSTMVHETKFEDFINLDDLGLIDRLKFTKSLISGVQSLHSSNITHGDLKPENIFVKVSEDGESLPIFVDIPDIDPAGAEKSSVEYADDLNPSESPEDRDRYAALLMITEALQGTNTRQAGQSYIEFPQVLLEDLEDEVNRLLADHDKVKSLDSVGSLIEEAITRATEPEPCRISLPLKNIESRSPLFPDGDSYWILAQHMKSENYEKLPVSKPAFSKNRQFEIIVFGVNGALRLVWDAEDDKVLTGRLDDNLPAFLRRKAARSWQAFIVFEPSLSSDFSPLEQPLSDVIKNYLEDQIIRAEPSRDSLVSEEDVDSQDEPSEYVGPPQASPSRKISVSSVWQALIDAEQDVLPEVILLDSPHNDDRAPRKVYFPYERANSYPIEFDAGDTIVVELIRDGHRPLQIGTLILADLTSDVMSVELSKHVSLEAGNRLKLKGVLEKASYDKRRQAVDRMINGKSINPELMEWFSGSRDEPVENNFDSAPWVNALPESLSLNNAQKEALHNSLVKSPISLVQGPPGTGKTLFIAALIYLVRENTGDNILLTSQSHEAVNNCIEKLISVYETDIDNLDIVRVGPAAMCSDSVAKYHIDNIQNRYLKDFEGDMRRRLEESAQTLGLPPQFTSQYIRICLATTPLLNQYRLELLEAKESEQGDVQKRIEGIEQSAKGRVSRISQRVSWPEDGDLNKKIDGVKDQLKTLHQISNENSVSRLQSLIDIAFEWKDSLSSPHGNFGEFLTRTKTIVAGTCVGIGRRQLNITNQRFDWVVVDEAARCTSSEMAIPAVVGERLVLVGDHRQLPPLYTTDLLAEAEASLPGVDQNQLRESDFKRIIESGYGNAGSRLLEKQYRMNKTIGTMVSDIFYKGKLQTAKSEFHLGELPSSHFLHSDVTWLDTSALGAKAMEQHEIDSLGRETKSWVNRGEIKEVLRVLTEISHDPNLVDSLMSFHHLHAEPIGVICAYAGQKRELVRAFRQRAFDDSFRALVKIDTVDSYQGKENLIIIQSLVRNNSKGSTGFLRSPERVNVSISRAMERLILVGSASMWDGADDPLGRVLSYIRERAPKLSKFRVLNAGDDLS